jgi:hypothetical protein
MAGAKLALAKPLLGDLVKPVLAGLVEMAEILKELQRVPHSAVLQAQRHAAAKHSAAFIELMLGEWAAKVSSLNAQRVKREHAVAAQKSRVQDLIVCVAGMATRPQQGPPAETQGPVSRSKRQRRIK